MKRYRVSNVEAFRQWEVDEEADTDRLIADICGLGEPSKAMAAGTALHSILEKLGAPGDRLAECGCAGFKFTFDGDFDLCLAPIRELRASKTYIVDGEPIVISGQVDAIDGLRIEDHKTTGRFDPDRYLAGYQWRLYLDIFGASMFRWNVFEMVDREESGHYIVHALHRLEQYRYPTLEADCVALVTRFARFVRDKIEAPA